VPCTLAGISAICSLNLLGGSRTARKSGKEARGGDQQRPATHGGTGPRHQSTPHQVPTWLQTQRSRQGSRLRDLPAQGFPPEARTGTHSLRAGGAMAMHLNGVSPITIRKQRQWSSDTFLMHIHEQVSAFSSGVSKLMAKSIGFRPPQRPRGGPCGRGRSITTYVVRL